MSLGMQPAQVVVLPLNDKRDVERMWDDYVKDLGLRLKRNRKADEYFNAEAEILNLSRHEKFEFFSRVEERDARSELSVWIHFKDGFLTQSDFPDAAEKLRDMLLQFEKLVRIEEVRRELEEEEKNLKAFSKDLEDLISSHQKYLQQIEQARMQIQENEKNIEQNLLDQEAMKKKIEDQRLKIQKTLDRIEQIKAE